MRFIAILTLLFALSCSNANAQWDTAGRARLRTHLAPAITSSAFITAGSIMAFNPTVNSIAVSLRDNVVRYNLPQLHFDDYLQYAPMAMPFVLNMCGLESRHSFLRMSNLAAASFLLGAGWLYAGKYGFNVLRPDASANNSFPSGHTFMAFTGAELLHREYGEQYPWIAVLGYMMAAVVGGMRVYNNRHWAGDVLAGAGLGVLSVSIVYFTMDK